MFSFHSLRLLRWNRDDSLGRTYAAVGPPPPPLPPPLKAPSSSSSSSQPNHYGPGSQTKSGSMTNGNNFYLHKHINNSGVGSQQNAMIFNTTGATSGSSSGQQQNAQHDYYNQLPQQQQLMQLQQNGEGPDSDSGLEVVEESTLKPSDLIRGNHNRSMSIISGKCPTNRSIVELSGFRESFGTKTNKGKCEKRVSPTRAWAVKIQIQRCETRSLRTTKEANRRHREPFKC